MFDSSGNHIEEGTEVTINVDNLSFQDNFGSLRKVKTINFWPMLPNFYEVGT